VSTLACLLLVGLLPAMSIARVDPNQLLKSRTGTGMHRRHRRVYAVMIVAQLGLALPLLIGAAMVMRSAWRLDHPAYFMDRLGYDPRPIVTATLNLVAPTGRAVTLAAPASDLVSRMRAIPGVVDAAVVGSGEPLNRGVTIEDEDGLSREVPAPAWKFTLVSPSYFRTMRRSVAAGRDFAEGAYDIPVSIIDEPTEHFLWPHSSAVGRLIKFGDARSTAPWTRIIGVAHDPRDTNIVRIMQPYNGYELGKIYRVFSSADSATAGAAGVPLSVVLRATGDAERTAITLRHTLWSMPWVSASNAQATMTGWVGERTREQFVATILDVFAVLGVALTALGVYGIVAHSVRARRREFGVRISLGATPRHILGNVLREGNVLVLAGAAIGLLLTRDTIGWIAAFVNGMDDYYDAPLFAEMAAVLAAIIAIAALIPAWRATRVDPVEALRAE
jgi:putative ABC transport system permease protein